MFDLSRIKKLLFPNVKDWTLDYPHIKDRSDYWELPTVEFIVFHPMGMKWFIMGTVAVGCVFSFIAAIAVQRIEFKGWILVAVPLYILSAILLFSTLRRAYEWKKPYRYTFYERFLKEYD